MSEIEEAPRTYSGALLGAIGVALVAALGGLIWCYTLNTKAATQATELADAKQANVKLAAEQRETAARLLYEYARAGMTIVEVPTRMNQRTAGESATGSIKGFWLTLRIILAVLVDCLEPALSQAEEQA